MPSQVRFTRAEAHPQCAGWRPVHGRRQNGYLLANVDVEPKELELTGPRGRVSRVTSVMTDQIDLSNVTGVSEFHVNVFVDDPFLRFESAPEAAVTVTMKKKKY